MIRSTRFFFLFHFFVQVVNLYAHETIYIPRHDESLIEAYLTTPQTDSNFPIIMLIQGSDPESVLANHDALAQRFLPHGIAILSVEKRGINSYAVDKQEFMEHDYFESRLKDFSSVLKVLEEDMIRRWNGRIILLGGSEGGKIAPRLSLDYAHFVSGTVLVGSGGGIPFAEEMKFQIQTAIENQNTVLKFISKIRSYVLPNEIDSQFSKILNHPDSLEICCSKTYRWWAAYLAYDPLPEMLEMNMPIYMIHGALDPKIPVESADAVKAAFEHAEKNNLTYARYDDLGHTLKGRDDVYTPLIEWVKRIFFLHKVPKEETILPLS